MPRAGPGCQRIRKSDRKSELAQMLRNTFEMGGTEQKSTLAKASRIYKCLSADKESRRRILGLVTHDGRRAAGPAAEAGANYRIIVRRVWGCRVCGRRECSQDGRDAVAAEGIRGNPPACFYVQLGPESHSAYFLRRRRIIPPDMGEPAGRFQSVYIYHRSDSSSNIRSRVRMGHSGFAKLRGRDGPPAPAPNIHKETYRHGVSEPITLGNA